MGDIKLEFPPIGVKVLKSLDGFGDIEVCKWAPVIPGLKPPENRFEKGIGRENNQEHHGRYVDMPQLYRDPVPRGCRQRLLFLHRGRRLGC